MEASSYGQQLRLVEQKTGLSNFTLGPSINTSARKGGGSKYWPSQKWWRLQFNFFKILNFVVIKSIFGKIKGIRKVYLNVYNFLVFEKKGGG